MRPRTPLYLFGSAMALLASLGCGSTSAAKSTSSPRTKPPTETLLGVIKTDRAFVEDVSADDRLVAVLTDTPSPYVVSLGTTSITKQVAYSPAHGSTVLFMSFRPTGHQLLSSDGFSISLWDTDSAKRLANLDVQAAFKDPLLKLDEIAWSADGETLFAYCDIVKCILAFPVTPKGVEPGKRLNVELNAFLRTRLVPSVQDRDSILAIANSGKGIRWNGVDPAPKDLPLIAESPVLAFEPSAGFAWMDKDGQAHLPSGKIRPTSAMQGGEKLRLLGDVLFVSSARRAAMTDLSGKNPPLAYELAEPSGSVIPLRTSAAFLTTNSKDRKLVLVRP